MKTIILSAYRCEGEYQGKPYSAGRLVIANFEGDRRYPCFISVAKTTAKIVDEIQEKLPSEAILSYDAFRRVTSIQFAKEVKT